MSTTEQQIAAFTQQAGLLLDLPQAIANTATAQINAVGNAYQARLNTSIGLYYVDQINGLDTNPGTQVAPLKTIGKALALVPMGGRCQCSLLGGYTLTENITVDNRQLVLLPVGTVRHPIEFTRKLVQTVTPNLRELAGFRLAGAAAITLYNLTINVPALDGSWGTINGGGGEVLFAPSGSLTWGPQAICMVNCDLRIPDPNFGALLHNSYPMSLLINGMTLLDQPLAGKVVRGVTSTAGTPTSTIPYLNTTLAAI